MNDKSTSLQSIVNESNQILKILLDLQKKAQINESTKLISIGRFTIARSIVPFLSTQDIINFRQTCKDINFACSSITALVSYYKLTNSKKTATVTPNTIQQLRNVENLSNPDDILTELESVRNVKNFLSKKLIECEKAYTLTRGDRDLLRSELKSQTQVLDKLTENLQTAEYELQQMKKENLNLKNNNEDLTKRYQDEKESIIQDIEKLRNQNKILQQEKGILKKEIINMKENQRQLEKKNSEKSEALKSLSNFFNSLVKTKVKNINELENEMKEINENK